MLTREEFERLSWIDIKPIEPLGKIYDSNGNEVETPETDYCECCGHELDKDND